MKKLKVSAPGRICLFGEHQDYLKLPAITAAINLRVTLSGHSRNDRMIHLNLPDIGSAEKFGLPKDGAETTYAGERDYFKSVLNVVQRAGIKIENGCECTVRGKIPKISTPKINYMLKNAIAAGAVGGKINGSGGGGCMFVYAPENPDEIAKTIEKAGGKAYIVAIDGGVAVE